MSRRLESIFAEIKRSSNENKELQRHLQTLKHKQEAVTSTVHNEKRFVQVELDALAKEKGDWDLARSKGGVMESELDAVRETKKQLDKTIVNVKEEIALAMTDLETTKKELTKAMASYYKIGGPIGFGAVKDCENKVEAEQKDLEKEIVDLNEEM